MVASLSLWYLINVLFHASFRFASVLLLLVARGGADVWCIRRFTQAKAKSTAKLLVNVWHMFGGL